MIIQSKRIWIVNTWCAGQLEIELGNIKRILPYRTIDADYDYGDKRIVPGFVDIHTHGAYGFDTNDAQEEGLRTWLKRVASEGVTGILPTTVTQSEEVLIAALKNVAHIVDKGYEGAEVLGIHLEGPYLNKNFKGAQPEQYCVQSNIEQFQRYWKASGHLIKIITMACERDTDYILTRFCVQNGIVVSQGHSGASAEEATMAIANGASSMTHVYNGMSPFRHREPGLTGSAFRFRNVYGEMVCDGNHSTLDALNNFFYAKGSDTGIMITDSLCVKGLPSGTKVLFGGNEIELYADGSAHLTATKGLAGSTLRMNMGLQILVEKALVPWQTAINSCTINPCRLLRIDDRKGSIQTGKDADLVVLNDDYSIDTTYGKGRILFDAKGEHYA